MIGVHPTPPIDSVLAEVGFRSSTAIGQMASRDLKLPLQGDERGLLRQDVLRCYVPAKHMREVGARITSH
jgi:hypothetical protein